MARADFFDTLHKGEIEGNLSQEEIRLLLSAEDPEEEETLLGTADRVRHRWVGNEVHLRGIVEFSNFCVQNCLYCGLRRDNLRLQRYRMTLPEVLKSAREIQAYGIPTVVLQSGEDSWFTRDKITELISRIKEETGLTITLSLGERSFAEYKEWKRAGADRYLLKFETSSFGRFRDLRPGRELDQRLQRLEWLKELGYQVGSGNIVGLPEQTPEDLVRDLLLFKEKNFDMIGIGPFIAHPQTPLARKPSGDAGTALRVLAVARLLTRDTNLPATTALGILEPGARRKALMAGANVIMPDLTPTRYRRYYDLYPGKTRKGQRLREIKGEILAIGRTIGHGPGGRSSA